MKSEIINIKIDPQTKRQARKIASDMGFSLSTILNAYLKQLVKSKAVYFSVAKEEPSEILINDLQEAEKDIRAGKVSPAFGNARDAVKWLHDPKAKYQNES